MDFLKQYLERAAAIIGERTPAEEDYDREVLTWFARGVPIRIALDQANEKYPTEALVVEASMLPDLKSRYEYLLEHERIIRKLKK